jgi:deazaflavin-dependent oxidoreductase (nitroreductase family)
MSAVHQPLQTELLPYPSHPVLRALFKSPILLYRLGLGWLVGRLFMILTTTGRKSGLPRPTAIEYHRLHGRKYVMNAYGTKSDWYRNLLADPLVTIQSVPDKVPGAVGHAIQGRDPCAYSSSTSPCTGPTE